jgi:hypothetical protein
MHLPRMISLNSRLQYIHIRILLGPDSMMQLPAIKRTLFRSQATTLDIFRFILSYHCQPIDNKTRVNNNKPSNTDMLDFREMGIGQAPKLVLLAPSRTRNTLLKFCRSYSPSLSL